MLHEIEPLLKVLKTIVHEEENLNFLTQGIKCINCINLGGGFSEMMISERKFFEIH